MTGDLAASGRPHHWSFRTSCSLERSKVRSATSRFSLLFSSSSLLQPPDLRHAHADELLLPAVEDRLGHTHLQADLVHRCTVLRLPQGEGDLLVREAFARLNVQDARKLALGSDQFGGSVSTVGLASAAGAYCATALCSLVYCL